MPAKSQQNQFASRALLEDEIKLDADDKGVIKEAWNWVLKIRGITTLHIMTMTGQKKLMMLIGRVSGSLNRVPLCALGSY